MRGQTVHKAYQKGTQYGKFNSLYGTGDHPKEGGKIVEGVSGKIHIMGGSDDGEFSRVEGDIMKANPKEGEYILAQRNGYRSLDEVPVDETTGYRKYSWLSEWLDKKTGGASTTAYNIMDITRGGYMPGGVDPIHTQGIGSWYDENITDPLQETFKIGEYSDEYARNEQLKEMLGTQTESAMAGQQKMETFIESNLQEQLSQFGAQEKMIQTNVAGQYGGVRDITQKTGLVTGGPAGAMKNIETVGKTQMATLGSKRRGAETQADMDKYKSKASTQQALASMISDYMTVSGEEVDDTMMSTFMEYMEDSGDAELNNTESSPRVSGAWLYPRNV